ncbi:hypothetical protein JL12_05695 [Gallibacterium anatis 10672-6]|uniref:dynamin family protein n=1 Tax=Gallibacterium anatis TaxID=750 RepID=UPI000531826F|nr:dynamin family protein [Gallibacterium anatis]KGQ50408.1 hypothetical protein JL12_05695 [Gallibacterium anatis 10672-6]
MSKIYIEYNPFITKTHFLVNGEQPEEQSFLHTYKEQRLQEWIDRFFIKVSEEIFNGGNYSVEFRGVENDWLDVQAEIKRAQYGDIKIQSKWIKEEDSANRLNDIKKLVEEAEQNPLFAKAMKEKDIQEKLSKAFSNDFDVYVAATMSAGKSTFINSLVGSELLPAANEATTAIIAEITDNKELPKGKFKGQRITKDGVIADSSEEVSLELLKNWNNTEIHNDTARIELEGDILGIAKRDNVRLVLSDTPGPNNSRDQDHQQVTINKISDTDKNPLICYLLNATQIGINDDKHTLTTIAETLNKGKSKQNNDRFLFLLNKADCFDEEKGESVKKMLDQCEKYLENNGITNPKIFPMSALSAYLLRKRQFNFDLTRNEKKLLDNWEFKALDDEEEGYEGLNFVNYMSLPSTVEAKLAHQDINKALLHTGIPAIEAVIDNYIDKYSMPERVSRAYEALSGAIIKASAKEELIVHLEGQAEELEKTQLMIQELKQTENQKSDAQNEVDQLINDAKKDRSKLGLDDVIAEIDDLEAEIRTKIAVKGREFSEAGVVSKEKAERRIDDLTEEVEYLSRKLLNSFDGIIHKAQEKTKSELNNIYRRYVDRFFEKTELPPITLSGLKNVVGNINLTLQDEEIGEVQVAVGKRKVGERSIATWYNPFSWGKTRAITETVYETREQVDLREMWGGEKGRVHEISAYFNKLTRVAKEQVVKDTDRMINHFSSVMVAEFSKQLETIAKEMSEKMSSRERLYKEIAQAKAKLDEIAEFESKVKEVLMFKEA